MGEYHDLYLKSNIPLSADVFENFGRLPCNIINWTDVISLQVLDYLGMQCLK